jgi:hypothetical protein
VGPAPYILFGIASWSAALACRPEASKTMSEPSGRDRNESLLSWPEPLVDEVSFEGGEDPSEEPRPRQSSTRKRDPAEALALAEAALVAARNEIALLRARVERLTLANEQLEVDLREARAAAAGQSA